jgi:hypothetical protein
VRDLPARDPKVVVVVLSWNRREDTLACVRSVLGSSYHNLEILLVDNASSDGTEVTLRGAFPHVRCLQTGSNLGYAGGNNKGTHWALAHGADYVLLLNDDTLVSPSCLEELVGFCERNATVGAAGPLVCFADSPEVVQTAGMRLQMTGVRVHQIGAGERAERFREPRVGVDCVNGVALFARRAALEGVGPLDEDYFLYNEEVDWCLRARRAGWELAVVPAARVLHKISARDRDLDPSVHYHQTRGRFVFLRKHGSWPHFIPLSLLVAKATLVAMLRAGGLRKALRLLGAAFRAVASGLRVKLRPSPTWKG